jgi:hypothetical protein
VELLVPEPEPVVDEAPLPEPTIAAIPEQNVTEMEPVQPHYQAPDQPPFRSCQLVQSVLCRFLFSIW